MLGWPEAGHLAYPHPRADVIGRLAPQRRWEFDEGQRLNVLVVGGVSDPPFV